MTIRKTLETTVLWFLVMSASIISVYSQTQPPPYPDSIDWARAVLRPDANYWEVVEQANDFFEQYPDHPDRKAFSRWAIFWESRVGDSLNSGSFQPALEMWGNSSNSCATAPFDLCEDEELASVWQPVGPDIFTTGTDPSDENWGNGRIQSILVDPHDPSFNTVWVGTSAFGLYRSVNAAGVPNEVSWQCMTCNLEYPVLGVPDITIDPTPPLPEEEPTIFISTGFDMWDHYYVGIGLLRSTDGGVSWCPVGPVLTDPWRNTVYSVVHHPTIKGEVFAAINGELFRSTDNGDSWSLVLDPYDEPTGPNNDGSQARLLRDIVFHPVNPDIIYVSSDDRGTNQGGAELFVSCDGGATWTLSSSAPLNNSNGFFPINHLSLGLGWKIERMDIGVCESLPTRIYLACTSFNGDQWAFCYSDDLVNSICEGGQSPTWAVNANTYGGSWHLQDLIVSPSNPDRAYIGSVKVGVTTNGGQSFQSVPTNHNDNRQLRVHDDGTGTDIVFSATDAGVAVNDNNGSGAWTDITGTGLMASTFYGLGVAGDLSFVVGGSTDVGILGYNSNTDEWNNYTCSGGGGDGGRCVVDPYDAGVYYSQQWSSGGIALRRNVRSGNAGSCSNFYSSSIPSSVDDARYLRPMQMHRNRYLYIGHKQVYRRYHDASSIWEQIGTLNGDVPIRSLAVAPSDENTIFIGRGGIDPLSVGKLMAYWDPTGDTSPSWAEVVIKDMPNSLFEYAGGLITDIVVDPHNSRRFWICTSRFDREYKVFMLEYEPEELAWKLSNISMGLPAVPCYSLVYQEGTKDVMYVATEVGVYFNPDAGDPDSAWKCFNRNLPICVAEDLEINYCTGELVLATFGHGIWKSPLVTGTTERPIEITANTTWNTRRILYADVVIKPGATLTIEGEILIASDRKITVQKGAKLIVDGGRLTSYCGRHWEGIIVEGDPTQPQSTGVNGPQGVVEMEDATIEFAKVAVRLYDPFSEAPAPGQTAGGVLRASNTAFRNNLTDVDFWPYQNINPPPLGEEYNLSGFYQCSFVSDDEFLPRSGAPETYTHVYMNGVRGVTFTKCRFADDRTEAQAAVSGFTGVHALNSYFKVQGVCQDPGTCDELEDIEPTEFQDLLFGIIASNFGASRNFTVDYCSFRNNHVGVQSNEVDFLSVTRSFFEVGGAPLQGAYTVHEGITIWGGTGYRIEENQFSAEIGGSNLFPIGVRVVQTGEDNNEIYLNGFSGMLAGNLSNGKNREDEPTSTGLMYRCNSNEDNSYDFSFPVYSMFYEEVGIHANQGSASEGAGNRFSSDPPQPETHFQNPVDEAITYYYKEIVPGDGHKPENVTLGGVGAEIALDAPDCQSELGEDPDIPNDPPLEEFEEHGEIWDSLTTEFAGLIDGGNTEGLVQSLSNASALDSASIQMLLLQLAPYGSAEALSAYLDRNDLFTEQQQYQVLSAHPEVLRNAGFWQLVLNASPAFSSQTIDSLEQDRLIRTARNDKEAEISRVAALRAKAARKLVIYYTSDSLAIQRDSIRYWTEAIGSLNHRYVLVEEWLEAADTLAADLEMASIPTEFSLSEEQQEEHAVFEMVVDLYKQMLGVNDWPVFAGQNESSVLSIAESSAERAGIQGKALVNYLFGITYLPEVVLPEGASYSRISGPETPPSQWNVGRSETENVVYLKVIPNPAADRLELQYRLGDSRQDAALVIRALTGRELMRWEVTGEGQITWSVAALPPGIYLASMEEAGGVIRQERFVVLH